jgi:hypothetical protein
MLARTCTLLWCRDFQCEQGGAAPPYRARSGATDTAAAAQGLPTSFQLAGAELTSHNGNLEAGAFCLATFAAGKVRPNEIWPQACGQSEDPAACGMGRDPPRFAHHSEQLKRTLLTVCKPCGGTMLGVRNSPLA